MELNKKNILLGWLVGAVAVVFFLIPIVMALHSK